MVVVRSNLFVAVPSPYSDALSYGMDAVSRLYLGDARAPGCARAANSLVRRPSELRAIPLRLPDRLYRKYFPTVTVTNDHELN